MKVALVKVSKYGMLVCLVLALILVAPLVASIVFPGLDGGDMSRSSSYLLKMAFPFLIFRFAAYIVLYMNYYRVIQWYCIRRGFTDAERDNLYAGKNGIAIVVLLFELATVFYLATGANL